MGLLDGVDRVPRGALDGARDVADDAVGVPGFAEHAGLDVDDQQRITVGINHQSV